jgi:type II secretory pathway pseudopilin PulG
MSVPRIIATPATRPGVARPSPAPGRGPRADHGFTVVETLVATVVLLVGVLGVAMLVVTSLGVNRTTRSREAATNLSREIVETARSLRYDQLAPAALGTALSALPGLGDADPATPGWQVDRRGVRFTVDVDACVRDDPKDGRAAPDPDTAWCSGGTVAARSSTPATDLSGDDWREVSVRVRAGSVDVPFVADVVNPTGGFGPRIRAVTGAPTPDADGVVRVDAATDRVRVDVTTSAAATLNWDAGDTRHGGGLPATGAGTSWPVSWSLGTPPSPSADVCGAPVDWTPDAPAYLATFQPFDRSGLPGDLRTVVVAVDRSLPYGVCDVAGGRNPRFGANGAGVVDLQWRPSFEGDVVSYRVTRTGADGRETDVCPATRTAECTDTDPPADDHDVEYRVRARQQGFALGGGEGAARSLVVASGAPGVGPAAPEAVAVAVDPADPRPVLAWRRSRDPDVALYRIYRDGTAVADRYGRVAADATDPSFVDRDPGGVPHTYAVSAVDRHFVESAATPAGSAP